MGTDSQKKQIKKQFIELAKVVFGTDKIIEDNTSSRSDYNSSFHAKVSEVEKATKLRVNYDTYFTLNTKQKPPSNFSLMLDNIVKARDANGLFDDSFALIAAKEKDSAKLEVLFDSNHGEKISNVLNAILQPDSLDKLKKSANPIETQLSGVISAKEAKIRDKKFKEANSNNGRYF